MISLLAALWGAENFILSLFALPRISKNPHYLTFVYSFAFINGAFVWEDMFMFGMFHTLSVLAAFLFGDLRIFLLFFIVFWIVRSAGETLYFFLQQFMVPTHHPHDISEHLKPLKNLFKGISDQKCFIIMQMVMQLTLIVSICTLILLLLSWHTIGILHPWAS